jgi:hypothetical protein
MSLFGFVKEITTAVVKTAVVPVAIASDVLNGDENFENTTDVLDSALTDLDEAVDEIVES